MTATIVTPAQENHNTVTKSGYQWLVWWFGNSAGFTTPRRAQEELARLQRYEAPQKQALSLLETLYTQYDSMAEQYEAMTQYIKTTFSLPKLNKVIDQLTADLMAVTECHPQMVQQAQAQAVGASMESAIIESREVAGDSDGVVADSVILNDITTALSPEDIRFDMHYTTKNTVNVHTFDEELGRIERGQLHFLNHDGDSQFMVNGEVIITFDNTDNSQTLSTKIAAYLNGEMRPQQVQQAQAQAVGKNGLTLGEQVAKITANSAPNEVVADSKSPAEYAEMYRNGLLNEAELFRLCPLAIPYVAKRTAWMAVDPRADYSAKQSTDQFGTQYHRSANGEWEAVTLVDGREGSAYTVDEALRYALAKPVPDSSELTLGDFVEAENEYPRPTVALFDDEELRDDSLGDLYEAPDNPDDLAYIVTSVHKNIFTLHAPANSHLAKILQVWLTIQHAIRFLEPCGYSMVNALKLDFGFFVTPKTLTRKIGKAIKWLNEAKLSGESLKATDEAAYIDDLVKNLEVLAC